MLQTCTPKSLDLVSVSQLDSHHAVCPDSYRSRRELLNEVLIRPLSLVIRVFKSRKNGCRRNIFFWGSAPDPVMSEPKQGDVRVGANGVHEGGGHTVEGERQAGAELELCALTRAREGGATQRRQPATQRPPDAPPRAVPGCVTVRCKAAGPTIRRGRRGRGLRASRREP